MEKYKLQQILAQGQLIQGQIIQTQGHRQQHTVGQEIHLEITVGLAEQRIQDNQIVAIADITAKVLQMQDIQAAITGHLANQDFLVVVLDHQAQIVQVGLEAVVVQAVVEEDKMKMGNFLDAHFFIFF